MKRPFSWLACAVDQEVDEDLALHSSTTREFIAQCRPNSRVRTALSDRNVAA